MRLLTLDRLPDATIDVECAPSKLQTLLFASAATAIAALLATMGAGLILRTGLPPFLFYFLAVFLALIAILIWFGFATLLRSDKYWLVRISGKTMWIRCAPEPGALIVEIEPSDLAWAEPCKVTWKSPSFFWNRGLLGGGSGNLWEFFPYLEIGLSPKAAALLERFLGDDRVAKDMRDQISPSPEVYTKPVRMIRPGVLCLCWRSMSPTLHRMGRILAPWTEVRPLRRERQGDA